MNLLKVTKFLMMAYICFLVSGNLICMTEFAYSGDSLMLCLLFAFLFI